MIQKDGHRGRATPSPSQQNKLARTILISILYFLFGATACAALFAFVIFLLIN